MKIFVPLIAVAFAGCGVALAQEPAKGQIYFGEANAAPSWAAQVPSSSAVTNQMAANAAWLQWEESACAQQRADSQKAWQKAETARAAYQTDPRNRMTRPEWGGAQYARVRGIIIDYSGLTQSGLISGEDGKRWPFRTADWVAPVDPAIGLWVDFAPETETGFALFVYSLGPFSTKHFELEHIGW